MLKYFFSAFITLVMTGCAVLDSRPPEVIVAERAQQRIDLLMEGDYEASYAFTTPGYRTTEGPGRYGTRWAGTSMWTHADVLNVRCDGSDTATRCKVAVKVEYVAVKVGGSSTVLREDWIFVDGNWFLHQNFSDG